MVDDNKPQVIVKAFLDEPTEQVLQKLAEENSFNAISVTPLERYGFGGAKLYKGFFAKDMTGIPFVVKVNDKEKIKKEVTSLLSVRTNFKPCLISSSFKPGYIDTYGAVTYELITREENKTLELKEWIINDNIPGAQVAEKLRELYERIYPTAHQAGKPTGIVFSQEYQKVDKDYLRNGLARSRIEQAIGKHPSKEECIVLGTEIPNPLLILNEGFKNEVYCYVGPVHGDLHSSNVMLGNKEEPNLIDFAWADPTGHLLKDFVLMENSLRFMLFPEYIHPDDQLKVDQALLEEEGFNKIRDIDFSNTSSKKLFCRLSESIRVIRVAAKRCTYGGDFNEYLASQFLVLYGLLSYKEYHFFPALRALGLIGSKLIGSKYVLTL